MTDEPADTAKDVVTPNNFRPLHGFEFLKLPRSDVSRITEQLGALVDVSQIRERFGALVPATRASDLVRDSALKTGAFASVHDQLEALTKAFTRELPVSKAILAETQRRNAFADMLPKVAPPPQVERSYLRGDPLAGVHRAQREREEARAAREEQTNRLLEETLRRQDAQLDISRQLVEASTPRHHTTRLLGFTAVAAFGANFAETWGGKLVALAAAAVVYGISEVVDRKARGPHPV